MLDKVKNNLIEILIGMFVILFLDWNIGYWANALFGAKFDLPSCWAGFAVLSGPGLLSVVKYAYDSKYNTKEGEGVQK